MSEHATLVKQLEDQIEVLAKTNKALQRRVDTTGLLYEIATSLNANLDMEAILTMAVNLAPHLDASAGEIYLLTDSGEVYFKSSILHRSNLNEDQQQALVYETLRESLQSEVLKTRRPSLISNASSPSEGIAEFRSFMNAPIVVNQGQLRGVLTFFHSDPNHFGEAGLRLLADIAAQIAIALGNASRLSDIESSLHETHLMLDISRRLAGASSLDEVYDALIQTVMAIGADRCTMYSCEELDNNNLPIYGQAVFIRDKHTPIDDSAYVRFTIKDYETLVDLIRSQETLVVENIKTDPLLSPDERTFFTQFNARSLVINPLVTRTYVIGLLSIEYRELHSFSERELALYRTLCNQTTIAIEHARQLQRTADALAETQTLYRAGRVLAGAADLQEILQESLVEFVYSLGLDQGGVTLLSSDRQVGQLMAYLEHGLLQDIQRLKFSIQENIPYQQELLGGRPFVSYDVPNDPYLAEFRSFNTTETIKSTLQAPMIIRGETVGWIGADAVREHREFTQREIDLARAMADQIAITIQNRRLLEQTELRADRLKAVAKVGEAVTGLTHHLDEILNLTVDLIRDRFKFYHVSIFLVDESREWAVVRASTGEVGKIMVARPHRLGVGSNSIVGYATANAVPRLALDVGEDKVHFENPLLPDTRSEMALPLISRGVVIGALDVQSVEANAFSEEDVETLQIMTNQLTAAIENARLFEQTQRRLSEQAALYRIGTRIGSTLNLQDAMNTLVLETAKILAVSECVITLLEENDKVFIISDYVEPGSNFKNKQGQHFALSESYLWGEIPISKKAVNIPREEVGNRQSLEFEYLRQHSGTVMAAVPILLRHKVMGLLEIYDDRPGRRFSQEDISLLDSIALQAANAIENTRLYANANESQTFMKAIINQLPDPIFIKDREHRWSVVNTAFAEGIMGLREEEVIGRTDYDYLSKEQADWFWEWDDKLFATGETQETEEPITDLKGKHRVLYTRKIPLTLNAEDGKPDYLIGIINDITDRKQHEVEREQLIEETRQTLERTQTLYRISDTLAAAADLRSTFEIVLGEYLRLLGLKQGSVMLYDKVTNTNQAQARFINGQPVEPTLAIPPEQDLLFQHMQKDPGSLVIENPTTHPFTQKHISERGRQNLTGMLFIPLMIRGELAGNLVLDATEGYVFNQNDIKIGEAIADQLNIWLENRQLLAEARYRSDRLQTAAEVSRAASSILDVDQLIETSVNLIYKQFNFYYVGLFLVDETQEWAVLKAGTGEAGRIQLEREHKLRIGGESMIGWSTANRKARIALDVGEEAVRFQNPYLPDTHSEMALPLIALDKVIGALTVQSVERRAFSDEDITLLQTMADQLANAIENANLFSQTQDALAETEKLYQMAQELSSARDEQSVYEIAMEAISGSGIDASTIYAYVTPYKGYNSTVDQLLEQKAVWTNNGATLFPNGTRFRASELILEDLIPAQGSLYIEDIDHDPHLTDQLRHLLKTAGYVSLLAMPLSTHQQRLGFLLTAYKSKSKKFAKNQVRFFTTTAQQMVIALENLRLLDASQRRLRREEIIREISSKIRNATEIEDILKTTVTELGKVLGTSKGHIKLGAGSVATQRPPSTTSLRGGLPSEYILNEVEGGTEGDPNAQ